MPNRILRDGILSSEAVCSLGWAEEVFYRRLLSVADDHGRFSASPKLIRSACYPLQIDKVSDADIGKWLACVQKAALVSVYPASDGKRYLQVEKFGQQVRSKSKFPDPIAEPLLTSASNCEQPPAVAHLDVVVCVDEDEGDKTLSRAVPAPVGVRAEVWDSWRRYRGRKLRAETLALQSKQLSEWAADGMDPNAILEQSIRNTWAGLFPLKNHVPAGNNVHAKRSATAQAMYGDTTLERPNEPTDITAESQRVA